MGWSYTIGQSKQRLIQERINPQGIDGHVYKSLAHCIRGNCLWQVIEHTFPSGVSKKFIALDLLSNEGGDGWGYKDMDESVGPYYYSCPLRYLQMVPVANQEWRHQVVAYHGRRNQHLQLYQLVKLTNGESYRVTNLKPLRGQSLKDGRVYRIPRRMLTVASAQQSQAA